MKQIINYIFFLIACNCFAGKTNENGCSAQVRLQIGFCHDTLSINGHKFVRTIDEDAVRFYCLTSSVGDTIIPFTDYYHRMRLLDINEDGATDVRIFIFSNTDNQCNNYLFDKQNNTFKLIENCDLDIQKIPGTDFYYSYNAIGCADMNWESSLSVMGDFQLIHKGLISGEGCDDVQKIKIYRIADGKQIPIDELPYTKHIPKHNDKWRFIERYWSENHLKFE